MSIYVLLVVTILILNTARKNRLVSDKAFSVIICGLFILITGLRADSVGADTWNYYSSFHEKSHYTLNQILALNKRDYGYFILEWFVSRYMGDFVFMTLIVACVFYIPISIFIYERSSDMGLSYLILLAFNFFQFSMTGMRQTLAFGFSLLFIREILKDKPNYFWAFVWIVIGMSMHKSCFIVLIYFVIKLVKRRLTVFLCSLGLIFIFFMYRVPISIMIINWFHEIGFDNYTKYDSGGGITTYVIYVILLIIGLLFTYRENKNNKPSMPNMYLLIIGVSTALQGLVYQNSIFFRMVWYFSIFLIIYIPELIKTFRVNKRDARFIKWMFYAGIFYMYFGITIDSAKSLPYLFFWQR